jgi:anti-sigma regulatory factor (Ser/Thr protein kinase)
LTRYFPVEDPSRVAEVRRAAAALSHDEGLDQTLAANAALISTEICTNLLKHARQGEVFLSTLSDRAGPGVEILAIDRGPGITDVAQCLADGYSSTNTPGTGLGAIARLSQEFDIYSQVDKGTVLVAQIRTRSRAKTFVGAVVKPIAGEEVAGDAWAFRERDGRLALIVADGLGHGLMAARASAEAISAFRRDSESAPIAVLNRVHAALRGTRGAAVAVADIDPAQGVVRYAGIGNISGVIVRSDKPLSMVSHNGTAGFHIPRLQEFLYPLPEEALIVMHSDGLTTNWNVDHYPGLRRRHPSIIAGVLYRDASRNRDDACVVAARITRAS